MGKGSSFPRIDPRTATSYVRRSSWACQDHLDHPIPQCPSPNSFEEAWAFQAYPFRRQRLPRSFRSRSSRSRGSLHPPYQFTCPARSVRCMPSIKLDAGRVLEDLNIVSDGALYICKSDTWNLQICGGHGSQQVPRVFVVDTIQEWLHHSEQLWHDLFGRFNLSDRDAGGLSNRDSV